MSMGNRLKEERERLGLTLPQFADIAGAKRNTVIDWQKDVSSPPAAKLAALLDIGVDVLYVLTGQREGPPALSPEQRALINNYEACTPLDRAFIRKAAATASQFHALTSRKKKPSHAAD